MKASRSSFIWISSFLQTRGYNIVNNSSTDGDFAIIFLAAWGSVIFVAASFFIFLDRQSRKRRTGSTGEKYRQTDR
jgi:hypothetical protein